MPRLVEFLARPSSLGPRYIIDPVAFFVALVGGPLIFTLGTFWIMLIPVAALGFGAIPYLVIGTPVLLFHLSRHPAKPSQLALLALLTMFGLSICLSIGAFISQNNDTFGLVLFVLFFGAIFAPAWAACFGWLYGKLCRELYAAPVPF
ncbi:MAG: hypothetical protein ACSHXB_18000 [Sulfitobacter sp.]